MGGDHADDYWKAMKTEIATLESMGAWEVVERSDDMNVIDSTWAFKCKRYPDGLIKKFKARFCARGDQQLEGIDFFETYAPVVQWTTGTCCSMDYSSVDADSRSVTWIEVEAG